MTRVDSPALRLALRVLYYLAVLVALTVVTSRTGRVAAGFVYQAF